MSRYTVQEGDTLWSIAASRLGDGNRYHEIKGLNNLDSDNIYPGQSLIMPGNGQGDTSPGADGISENDFVEALTKNGYPTQSQKYNYFIQSLSEAGIGTKSEAAMYLATLLHESDGLRVTEEYYNPLSIQTYGRYIGRGYIQLSSQPNYQAASEALNEDYVSNPEKVSTDPHAWRVSAWYWRKEVQQHVPSGFEATVIRGVRPLEPHMERRRAIYGNVCQAFGVTAI